MEQVKEYLGIDWRAHRDLIRSLDSGRSEEDELESISLAWRVGFVVSAVEDHGFEVDASEEASETRCVALENVASGKASGPISDSYCVWVGGVVRFGHQAYGVAWLECVVLDFFAVIFPGSRHIERKNPEFFPMLPLTFMGGPISTVRGREAEPFVLWLEPASVVPSAEAQDGETFVVLGFRVDGIAGRL